MKRITNKKIILLKGQLKFDVKSNWRKLLARYIFNNKTVKNIVLKVDDGIELDKKLNKLQDVQISSDDIENRLDEGYDFITALYWLKQGFKIRKKSWADKDSYLWTKHRYKGDEEIEIYFKTHNNKIKFRFTFVEFEASDWEIYKK